MTTLTALETLCSGGGLDVWTAGVDALGREMVRLFGVDPKDNSSGLLSGFLLRGTEDARDHLG